MNQQKITDYYNEVLRLENLPKIPLRFCKVAKAGACVVFNSITITPVETQIDLTHCKDAEYAILHEIAHISMMIKKKIAGHPVAFKKEESRLVDKYMYSSLSFKCFIG